MPSSSMPGTAESTGVLLGSRAGATSSARMIIFPVRLQGCGVTPKQLEYVNKYAEERGRRGVEQPGAHVEG